MRPTTVKDFINTLQRDHSPDDTVMVSRWAAEDGHDIHPRDWKAFCERWTHHETDYALDEQAGFLNHMAEIFYREKGGQAGSAKTFKQAKFEAFEASLVETSFGRVCQYDLDPSLVRSEKTWLEFKSWIQETDYKPVDHQSLIKTFWEWRSSEEIAD